MPVRSKLFMRKIVKVETSAELTKRGNPRHYTFTLECGHTRREFHGPYSVVRAAAFDILTKEGEQPDLKMHCYDCASEKTPSPKCEKTQLPIGIMPYLGYCKQKCSDDQIQKCAKAYQEWTKT